jgi:hypothetical protein
LYALWRASPLATDHYPTVLVAWNASGEEGVELRLAALELPTPLLAALARLQPDGGPRVERLERVPECTTC